MFFFCAFSQEKVYPFYEYAKGNWTVTVNHPFQENDEPETLFLNINETAYSIYSDYNMTEYVQGGPAEFHNGTLFSFDGIEFKADIAEHHFFIFSLTERYYIRANAYDDSAKYFYGECYDKETIDTIIYKLDKYKVPPTKFQQYSGMIFPVIMFAGTFGMQYFMKGKAAQIQQQQEAARRAKAKRDAEMKESEEKKDEEKKEEEEDEEEEEEEEKNENKPADTKDEGKVE